MGGSYSRSCNDQFLPLTMSPFLCKCVKKLPKSGWRLCGSVNVRDGDGVERCKRIENH